MAAVKWLINSVVRSNDPVRRNSQRSEELRTVNRLDYRLQKKSVVGILNVQQSLANAKVSARQPWYIGHNSLNHPSLAFNSGKIVNNVEINAQSSADFALTYNFQGTHRPILGASRGHLCDSKAFLLIIS